MIRQNQSQQSLRALVAERQEEAMRSFPLTPD